MASSRKRFCNEDISLRFQSPPGRESLERQSSFPLSDASLVSPGGLSVLSGHSQGSDIEAVYGRDTGVPKEIIRTVNQVSVRLQEEELWNAFGALQTEMIINRGGRLVTRPQASDI